MVGFSNRSASPLTSRSISSLPTSLEPHQTQPIRKSFNATNNFSRPSYLTNPRKFNSITPANSPAEIGGRNYVAGEEKENEKAQFLKDAAKLRSPSNGSKNSMAPTISAEIIGRNYVAGEEKENEKAQFLKAASKLRSPSNGSKNFMAPTISAAIKFTPSPRRKILVDRNDPVRTSITLSDGKATFFSSYFDKDNDVCFEEKSNEADVPLAVQEVPIVPKALKKVTFEEVKCSTNNLAESFIEEVPICSDSEDSVDNSSVELSSISLSCPPHEPKSDILSSPKFDVGKMDFEGFDCDEIKQLEDSCMCELSENLPFSEGLDKCQTGDSWEMLEDVSSIENLGDEYLPLSTPIGDAITEDVVPKQAMKPHAFGNWKAVCFVLVLLGTFMLPIINFVTIDSFVPKDFNFELPELSEVAGMAKVNLDEFGGKVKQWSSDSIPYLYKMVLPILEVDKMGPLQFMNLTVLEDDYQISSFFNVNSKGNEFEEYMGLQLKDENEDEMEEVDDGMKEDEQETEEGEDEMVEVDDGIQDDEQEMEEVADEMDDVEDEMKEAEETDISFDSTVHMVSPAKALESELKTDTSVDDHSLAETEKSHGEKTDTSVDDHFLAKTEKSHGEKEIESSVATWKLRNQQSSPDMVSIPESPDTIHLDASEIDYYSSATETEMLLEEHQSCSSVESGKTEGEHKSFLDEGFIHESGQIPQVSDSSFGKSRIQATIEILGSLGLLGLATVALVIYLKHSKRVSTNVDTNPICNKKNNVKPPKGPSNEDVVGESCASEMSSSHRSSSSYQRKKDNSKSESFVYSGEYSFGSPSYGSFTAYEAIPIRHVGGEEEIVTPVRRSSRIRKQLTSQ